MGNKYTWVIFNLLLSLCGFVFCFFVMPNDPKDGWLWLLVTGAFCFWIYKSIQFWRKCIQSDDPAFNRIVEEINQDS